jgi:23S rRNA pseudouridine955/2504/2580 synthase
MILHEDEDIIVVNKTPGIAVQGGTGTERHLDGLMAVFADEEHGKPKLIHRLDRDTSGVLVFGRNPAATTALGKAFRARTTQKVYWAVCLGVPHPLRGEIRGWMKKAGSALNPDRELMRRAAHGEKDALFAITDYRSDHQCRHACQLAGLEAGHRPHPPAALPHGRGGLRHRRRQQVCLRPAPDRRPCRAACTCMPAPCAFPIRRGGILTLIADMPPHMR